MTSKDRLALMLKNTGLFIWVLCFRMIIIAQIMVIKLWRQSDKRVEAASECKAGRIEVFVLTVRAIRHSRISMVANNWWFGLGRNGAFPIQMAIHYQDSHFHTWALLGM